MPIESLTSCSVFGSRTVTRHFLRGGIAASLLAFAVLNELSSPPLTIAAVGLAVFFMRGCPMCWTVGLFETIVMRLKARM
jgi:hypothetical protein